MQPPQIDDLGFCPSFSCYSSDSLASTAAGRISTQLLQEQSFHDVDGENEFEFSVLLGDEESNGRTDFPLFNRDLAIQEVDREALQGKLADEEEIASSSSDESDGGVFCVWRFKTEGGSSPLSKCKKSGSTGSGSKRWRIRDLLRRSNSEGKEPMVLLTDRKKVEIPKQKRSTGEASSIVAGKSKPKPLSPSIHELFYLRRAKGEGGKRKSYLPYRQGLVGFFSNVNGSF
ncbi:hypothetical protein SSX86_018902 [Deinandra increscens subsp. villosa]|uniref:Uncharacterized protein n=1 Tax=Deinandra increscens subsp. villosa TaxID=3103831 RepID=A0AAP0CYR4_9ASTR